MSVSTPALAPHELIWGITNAAVSARALHLVAQLRVADHVDEEPVTAADLASHCGVDAGAPERVLRLLATQGIFGLQGGGVRAHRRLAPAPERPPDVDVGLRPA